MFVDMAGENKEVVLADTLSPGKQDNFSTVSIFASLVHYLIMLKVIGRSIAAICMVCKCEHLETDHSTHFNCPLHVNYLIPLI